MKLNKIYKQITISLLKYLELIKVKNFRIIMKFRRGSLYGNKYSYKTGNLYEEINKNINNKKRIKLWK